ncbi:Rve-domain-containing hypothetical protein [Phytophthora megakarya]|uniref:Integrase catalytic domain-containing protein n=1 Tax=Phytophthora megakarya TaxID=4795 RepID=A0A225WX12_9STRA|nr:Rve-domain-containing hypothetical protein [Phytophthora megakarya]
MDATSVQLWDIPYIPEVSKQAEKDVVAQFSKDRHITTTPRKEPWTVAHTRLDFHIPFKCYEDLLATADGVPIITGNVTSDDMCAGYSMGKMRVDDFPRYLEKLVKCAGVLDLVHTDVMGPMQTTTPGGCKYVVTFIDKYSHHMTIHFTKAKADVLSKLKIYEAVTENLTVKTIKLLHLGNYSGRLFKSYLNHHGIKHVNTVPYTLQRNVVDERNNRSFIEMARPHQKLEAFGSLGYSHIADEKGRKLDAKAFKYRYMEYEDGVKKYFVMDVPTGKVRIVRPVKFMAITTTDRLVTRQYLSEEEALVEPTLSGQ